MFIYKFRKITDYYSNSQLLLRIRVSRTISYQISYLAKQSTINTKTTNTSSITILEDAKRKTRVGRFEKSSQGSALASRIRLIRGITTSPPLLSASTTRCSRSLRRTRPTREYAPSSTRSILSRNQRLRISERNSPFCSSS